MLYSSTRIYAMVCTMFLHADTKHLTLPRNVRTMIASQKGVSEKIQ